MSGLSLSLSSPLVPTWREHFKVQSRLIYDFAVRGTLLRTGIEISPSRHWRLSIGADLLTAALERDPYEGGADFLYSYRRKDRAYGGLTYVF